MSGLSMYQTCLVAAQELAQRDWQLVLSLVDPRQTHSSHSMVQKRAVMKFRICTMSVHLVSSTSLTLLTQNVPAHLVWTATLLSASNWTVVLP